MKTTSLLAALAACTTLAVGSATADTIKVDIQQSGATTQTGWTGWTPSSGAVSVTSTDGTDGTIEATLAGSQGATERAYGTSTVTDPGSLTNADVWGDQWFLGNNFNATFTLTLDDLKAGTYSFTSYHFANSLKGTGSQYDEGTMSVSVNGGDTGEDVTFVNGSPSQIAGGAPSSADLDTYGKVTFQFTVASDGDAVTILYDNNATAQSQGDTIGINGFELTQVVPEPGSLALMGLGGLCVLRRRRG